MKLYRGYFKKEDKKLAEDPVFLSSKQEAKKYGDTVAEVDIPKSNLSCNKDIDDPKNIYCKIKKVKK